MIPLQLQDVPFEQDVRELFMASFPGQSFSHVLGQDTTISCIMTAGAEAGNEEAGRLGTYHATLLTDRGERLSFESPWFSKCPTPKNESKWASYRTLSTLTGKELSWGTLIGIRLVKFALNLLQRGKTTEEIRIEFKRSFSLSNARNTLRVRAAENELRAIRGLDSTTGYNLYIGTPFCPATCLYRSFSSYLAGKNKAAPYLAALREEFRLTAEMMAGKRPDAVYVGDDTPTSLTAEELHSLLLFMCETSDFSAYWEFTVEAGRPDNITREKLLALREAGVDRININPQTLEQTALDLIGRFHMVEQPTGSFALAGELGSDNINTDLIMGPPSETETDVRRVMEGICALSLNDVTIHSLVLKRAARLNTEREDYRDTCYDDANQMVEFAVFYCEETRLSPYYLYRQKNMADGLENVGWCRPGKEGLYNILIMGEPGTIVGCGAGMTTRVIRGEEQYDRPENVKDSALYVERLPELLAKKQRTLVGDALG